MGNLTLGRRAIHEGQKEQRRSDILDAAWRLFQHTSYEALTVADIAEESGLAKGTVFLYFKTKEALFLAVLEQQVVEWFAEVDSQLAGLDRKGAIPKVANTLLGALETRPGLVRLLAILHTVLESNIDLDEATAFKHFLLAHFKRTGALLERRLSFLKAGEGAHLLMQSHALAIGLWHLSDPTPVVRQALQQPDLQVFRVSFAKEFPAALKALLFGLKRAATKGEK